MSLRTYINAAITILGILTLVGCGSDNSDQRMQEAAADEAGHELYQQGRSRIMVRRVTDFGHVTAGEASIRELKVKNYGRMVRYRVIASENSPFFLHSYGDCKRYYFKGRGNSCTLEIGVRSADLGLASDSFKLSIHNGQQIELKLRAKITK